MCYLIESSKWESTAYMTEIYAKLFLGSCILLILVASLFLCLFFRRLTLDKKILILFGFTAVALGLLGISGIVFENKISFIDAVYKTFQLFVGEFGDVSFEVGTFPLLLNISRFLALFVTFGAIVILLAKEKILQISIRLAYRDTVLITDSINRRITAIIDRLHEDNRRLVIGLIDSSQSSVTIFQDENSPIVSFNIEKDLHKGLSACNIKKAACIFLICSDTSDNIRIYRNILQLKKEKSKKEITPQERNKNSSQTPLSDLYKNFRKSLNEPPEHSSIENKIHKTICYLHYTEASEKEYYSLDESLSDRSGSFETYFINLTETAIRQMISRISLSNLTKKDNIAGNHNPMDDLRNIKIGVSGSDELFYSTLKEILRIFIFSDFPPLNIYNLYDKNSLDPTRGISARGALKPLLNLIDLPISPLPENSHGPDILFICSDDVIEIRSILHSVFQSGLSSSIREYIIITETSQVDMEILRKYVDALISSCRRNKTIPSNPPSGTVIRMANVINLIMTIDDFYKAYGPDFRKVHDAYMTAMPNGKLNDFNKLPEVFIESNLLNSIHNNLLLEYTSRLNSIGKDLITDEFLEFLTATEHERWFNERTLRGFVYSEKTNYMLNTNSYLKHWNNLDKVKQETNIRYVIEELMELSKSNRKKYEIILKDFISEYRFYSTLEDF